MADEAQGQIESLRARVRGEILEAHSNLNSFIIQYQVQKNIVNKLAGLQIFNEHTTVVNQVKSLANLAASAGVDASVCTEPRQEVVDNLANKHYNNLFGCINNVTQKANQLVDDATYQVDIEINTVNRLEFQLNQCNGELLCISTLVTEIELNEIRLPENIKTTVNTVEDLVNSMTGSLNECGNIHVAAFQSECTTNINEIESCIENLIP